jgi:uncharacterized protein
MRATRRGVLCAACAAAASRWPAFAGTPAGAREVFRPFDYGAVQLTGGPLKAQYDWVHAHYLALDDDRLLKPYREHAGLPAPGEEMGGWYGADGFVAGHALGQYVSGLARIGATTGDEACHAKVRALVAGFAECLAKNPNPYAGPKAQELWAAYVLDKHEIGLVDAWRLSGDAQAKALLPTVVKGALPYVSPVSRDRVGKKDPPYDETYVLPETLYEVAEVTGDRRWRALADHYLLDPEFFDPLARGEDVFPGKHAYSHAIALSSGAKAYLVTGDAKYLRALENAWGFLERQRFASGGWGPDEQFVQPETGALHAALYKTKDHFETPCGGYASMKLHNYLMRFTGEAKYGDGMERIVYNAMLGVKRPDSDGDYPYYSTYGPMAEKVYYPSKWPCCSGTLVQAVADYVQNVYYRTPEGVAVSLYTPSTLSWAPTAGAPVQLVQETAYPAADTVRITVRTAAPQGFGLSLRIPGWLQRPAAISVNGKAVDGAAQAGGFADLRRTWADGDVVELTLPQSFRTEALAPETPDTVALMRGGIMYVGLDPWPGLDQQPVALPAGLQPVAGQPQAFTHEVQGKALVFTPFYALQDERYSTYFRKA